MSDEILLFSISKPYELSSWNENGEVLCNGILTTDVLISPSHTEKIINVGLEINDVVVNMPSSYIRRQIPKGERGLISNDEFEELLDTAKENYSKEIVDIFEEFLNKVNKKNAGIYQEIVPYNIYSFNSELVLKTIQHTFEKGQKSNDELKKEITRLRENILKNDKYMKDMKEKYDEIKKENKVLMSEIRSYKKSLHAYEGHPTLFNPKESIFKWRDGNGELIIAPIAEPILRAIYDDTIDSYKVGMAKDGTVIFKKNFYIQKKGDFPILEGVLPTLKEIVKKAIDEGKLIINIERMKKEIKRSIWNILDEKGFDGRKEDTIEKIWDALFDLGGANIPTSKIVKQTNVSKRIVLKRLKLFEQYGFVEMKKEKNRFIWSLKEPFLTLNKNV